MPTAGYNKYRGWCKKLGHDLTNENYDTVTNFADLTKGGALDSIMVDTLKNKAGYAVTIIFMSVHMSIHVLHTETIRLILID